MFKKLKNYRKKAKELANEIRDKRKKHIKDGNLNLKEWREDYKLAAKELKQYRKDNAISLVGLTPEQREQRKKELKLWLEAIYWLISVAGKYLPLSPPLQLLMRVMDILKFYNKLGGGK